MNIIFLSYSVIRGVGELDTSGNNNNNTVESEEKEEQTQKDIVAPDPLSLPYLLLDIRDSDAFEEGHIIGGKCSFGGNFQGKSFKADGSK